VEDKPGTIYKNIMIFKKNRPGTPRQDGLLTQPIRVSVPIFPLITNPRHLSDLGDRSEQQGEGGQI
jgi:hypothetical protein